MLHYSSEVQCSVGVQWSVTKDPSCLAAVHPPAPGYREKVQVQLTTFVRFKKFHEVFINQAYVGLHFYMGMFIIIKWVLKHKVAMAQKKKLKKNK